MSWSYIIIDGVLEQQCSLASSLSEYNADSSHCDARPTVSLIAAENQVIPYPNNSSPDILRQTFPLPDNSPCLFTWCRTFPPPHSANLQCKVIYR